MKGFRVVSETFFNLSSLQNYWLQYHCKDWTSIFCAQLRAFALDWTVSSVNWKRADVIFVTDYHFFGHDEVCCRGPTRGIVGSVA